MQQRYATSEFRLDSRCARYREVHFPGGAQIARFGNSCAFDVAYRKKINTSQSGKEKYVTPTAKHS
ncbi:MAG: hypothetical protein DME83_10060 [Verrucomicrobia bacterium]|nr:MAG: hypothetical protein DME83_10060 [Verrucomicrobiota bacterium]